MKQIFHVKNATTYAVEKIARRNIYQPININATKCYINDTQKYEYSYGKILKNIYFN